MHSKPVPPPETRGALAGAYETLQSSKKAPGKNEQMIDNVGNNVVAASESPTLTFLNNFCEANRSTINSAAAGITSLDEKAISQAISGFPSTVKVIMDGLDALGQIHPFISVAVVAFKLVVTLDMTRRENNQKVMAVQIQMQQMMCTLFQLRQVKNPDVIAPDGKVLKDYLRPLMEDIARDIKECGSACDVYLKKRFITKLLKSVIYEARLTEYITKFMDYRDQLDKALTVHTALGVDEANQRLRSIEGKLDLVFRRLDTPHERRVLEFIEWNGGPEAVLERNDLIQALVEISGETMANLAGMSLTSKDSIDSVRDKLKQELVESIDIELEQNFVLFYNKLDIQEENIKKALEKQKELIVGALSGADKIKDPDLREMWKDMGWKGSVKARRFVMDLHDYFTSKFSTGAYLPWASGAPISQVPLLEPTSSTTDPSTTRLEKHWALDYLNVHNLQSILEAIDDDGSGIISIKEVNAFVIECPKGWSLLQWIAFWAKGWEMSLAEYKHKIIAILQEMTRCFPNALKENWRGMDIYLKETIATIGPILQSAKMVEGRGQACHQLVSLAAAYMDAEERRIQCNLEKIGYDVDNAATVTLVTGPGRIERYLFPLLYLMLKRHLEVFHYSCRNIVDKEEFPHMSMTLESIFDVVKQRCEALKAICKQTHLDPSTHLENFALGIFHSFVVDKYKSGLEASPLAAWPDIQLKASNRNKIIEVAGKSKPIFTKPGPEDGHHGVWNDWPPHSFETNPYTGTIDGFWTGRLRAMKGSEDIFGLNAIGLAQLKIEVDSEDSNGHLRGFGAMYTSWFSIHGQRQRGKSTDPDSDEFDVVLLRKDGNPMRLVGRLVEAAEELVGEWEIFDEDESAMEAYKAHPFRIASQSPGLTTQNFVFRRTPVEVHRFRHILDQHESKAKARWYFLREAILCLIRSRLRSWSHIKAWGADRRAFLDYYRRDLLCQYEFVIHSPLNPVEEKQWYNLKSHLPPMFIQPCVEMSLWSLDRLPIHYELRCDGCHRRVIEVRYICLTCTDYNVSYSFNLCSKCMDKPVRCKEPPIVHTVDHTLIKCRQYVPLYLTPWLINKARTMTTRLKKTFLEVRRGWQNMPQFAPGCIPFAPSSGPFATSGLHIPPYLPAPPSDPFVPSGPHVPPSSLSAPPPVPFVPSGPHVPPSASPPVPSAPPPILFAPPPVPFAPPPILFAPSGPYAPPSGPFPPPSSPFAPFSHSRPFPPAFGSIQPRCGCCMFQVMIPCWVCIICTPETYTCNACEEKEFKGVLLPSNHSDHYLLRLHNTEPASFEREEVDPIVARVDALETMVNKRFEDPESRVMDLETNIEALLTSKLEAFFRKIAKLPEVDEGDGTQDSTGVNDSESDEGEGTQDSRIITDSDGDEGEGIQDGKVIANSDSGDQPQGEALVD